MYDTAKSFLLSYDSTSASLVQYLPKTFGFITGLEYKDTTLGLNGVNTTRFQGGMVFNVTVGFHNVVMDMAERKKSINVNVKNMEKFSLLLGDTLLIQKDGSIPEILTKASKSIGDITYNISDKKVHHIYIV